ncbi:MAG TPA: hypothetical protein VGM91_12455 [Conexibacter sp.]|jgi:hypothetical protein
MRPRLALPAAALPASLAAAALIAVPSLASAAPIHNRGLTIAAAPNPATTGEPVLVYGHLNGPANSHRRITLWHKIPGVTFGYRVVQRTTTDAAGNWAIQRRPGVVTTNRSWFVTAGSGVHSRTAFERVAPTVTLAEPTSPADTRTPVTLTGSVAPNHTGQAVELQQQTGADGNTWKTIDRGRLRQGSTFSIAHRFRQPGDLTLRILFRADRRSTRGESTPVTLTVQQQQSDSLTIASSASAVDFGQSVTINGTVAGAAAGTPVTLFARDEWQPGQLTAIGTATTDASGAYAFTQSPPRNTVYEVRTTTAPKRHSARLFVGVRSVVTLVPSTSSAKVGDSITLSGTTTPGKPGHAILLQQVGSDGIWRTIAAGRVGADASYSFADVLDAPGTERLRAVLPGGPVNERAISSEATVDVAAAPPAALPGSALPSAS